MQIPWLQGTINEQGLECGESRYAFIYLFFIKRKEFIVLTACTNITFPRENQRRDYLYKVIYNYFVQSNTYINKVILT